jgi:hypothetical protein
MKLVQKSATGSVHGLVEMWVMVSVAKWAVDLGRVLAGKLVTELVGW